MVALAYRFTGDRDDALDVLQDTFAYFFGKFPGFALTAALKTFLYPTVKHLCLTRRRKHGSTVDIEDLADELPAPASLLSQSAASDLVRIVADLPAQQREVVLLRFVDDLSLRQIADALVIPLGTVKSRLHHALETLRRQVRGS